MPEHLRLVLLAALLAGCSETEQAETADAMVADDAGLPVCDEPRRVRFGASAHLEDTNAEYPYAFRGVVEAIERPDSEGYVLSISDGGGVMSVAVDLPWTTPFVEIGDTVSVEYAAQSSIEWGTSAALTMRDWNGELLFWFLMTSHGFDHFDPPEELTVRDGEPTCMSQVPSCPDVRHELIAKSEGSGDVAIELGEMADVGDYVVLHGRNTSGMCDFASDPYYHSVTLAAVRGSRASLDAAGASDSSNEPEELPLPECTFAPPPGIAVCGGGIEPSGAELPERFTAVVEAITGDGCGQALGNTPPSGFTGYTLTLNDGEITAKVTMYSPSLPTVRVGDTVTLEYEAHFYFESPSFGSMTLRDADGELLFWFAVTNKGFGDLAMPELTLSNGEATCQREEPSCGIVTQGSIVASGGALGRVTIEYGEMATIGEYVVVHGDNTKRPESCLGNAGQSVVVAVVRKRSASEPDDDAGSR